MRRAAALELALNGRQLANLLRLPPGVSRSGAVQGRVTDASGQTLPGTTITVTNELTNASVATVTDANGEYLVTGLPPMRFTVMAELSGLSSSAVRAVDLSRSSARVDLVMAAGTHSETLEVVAVSPVVETTSSYSAQLIRADDPMAVAQRAAEEAEEARRTTPSANVASLQRRVAGVLPVEVEVPRAGTSHRFVRPLVLDEETRLQFRYRMR
jgi:hypothetical protein